MNSNHNCEKSLKRLDLVRKQIIGNRCLNSGKITQKSDDDVVIVAACRTPLTKSGKGLLKDTLPEILTSGVIVELLKRGKAKPEQIEEIIFGNVLQNGAGFMSARMSQFLAGIPETTSLMTVNRLCSSGLQAVMNAAYSIASKQIDIAIAGGVESMSMYDMNNLVDGEKVSEEVFNCPKAANCMIPMGITSENVVEKFGIDRKTQDLFAVESHKKAAAAQKGGLFDEEIVAINTKVKQKDGSLKDVTVTKDDGIREDTKFESLQKLKASFKQGGTTTAGNSSQVTDGAAGVLLMRRSVAKKNGCPIIGRIIGYAVAGVPPEIMGIGPAFAIPKVLKNTGLKIEDIGIFELNEAFASQATYCADVLKIPKEKVNPKGGAIALGHPLGCTGARQIATLLPELKRQNQKYGLISMCIGTGMGAACILERE
jgi:acetyl-CoA acyltransferase 1